MKSPWKFAACAAIVGAVSVNSALLGQSNATGTAPAPGVPIFAYGGDAAQIPAQFIDHLVFLSPRVSLSQPSLFEIDTTAATTSIAPDRAAEIGRTGAQFPVLNLEGMDFPLAALPETPNTDFITRMGLEYQGTLGRDFLANLVLQIDYSRLTVRAYAPANYKYSGKGIVLPLAQADGVPVIPIRFALLRGRETTANFVVATALDATVVFDNKFLTAHHMLGDRGKTLPTIDPISGEPGATLARLRTFEISKSLANDTQAVFSDQTFPGAGPQVAGAIGAGLLRRFTVVFDYPHHQLILEPNIQFPDPDQEDKSGVLIVGKGPNYKTFEVVAVQPNSPAAIAGLKKGDIIAGVDVDPAGDLTLLTVRDLFRQVGHKYKITFEREGQTKEVTLETHRYF
jgi:hypothetical protein